MLPCPNPTTLPNSREHRMSCCSENRGLSSAQVLRSSVARRNSHQVLGFLLGNEGGGLERWFSWADWARGHVQSENKTDCITSLCCKPWPLFPTANRKRKDVFFKSKENVLYFYFFFWLQGNSVEIRDSRWNYLCERFHKQAVFITSIV